jgi:hypothetical protein
VFPWSGEIAAATGVARRARVAVVDWLSRGDKLATSCRP